MMIQRQSYYKHYPAVSLTVLLIAGILVTLLIPTVIWLSHLESLVYHLSNYDLRRLSMSMTLIVPAIYLVYASSVRQKVYEVFIGLPVLCQYGLLLYIIIMLLGSITSIAPWQSLLVSSEQLLLLVMVFVVAGLCSTHQLVRQWFLTGLIIISLLYMLLSLYLFVYVDEINHRSGAFFLNQLYLFLNFSNPRFFAQYLSVILPLLGLPLLYKKPHLLIKVLCFVVLCYFWMLFQSNNSKTLYLEWAILYVVLPFIAGKQALRLLSLNLIAYIFAIVLQVLIAPTFSRHTWLFLCVYAFVLLLHSLFALGTRNHLKGVLVLFANKTWLFIISCMIVLIIGILTWCYYPALTVLFDDFGRSDIWRVSLTNWLAHWLLGVGSGMLPFYGIEVIQGYNATVIAQPHNFVIRILTENGLIGLLALSIPLIYGSITVVNKTLISKRQTLVTPERVALLASLITLAIHAMTSGVMATPLSQLMVVIVAGVMLQEFGTNKMLRLTNKVTIISKLALTCLVVITAYFVVASYYSVINVNHVNATRQCGQTASPFYWYEGSVSLDYPGQYFCMRNLIELQYWSEYGPFKVELIKE